MVKIIHKIRNCLLLLGRKITGWFELCLAGVYIGGKETLQIREFLRFYKRWVFLKHKTKYFVFKAFRIRQNAPIWIKHFSGISFSVTCEIQQQNQLIPSHISFNSLLKYRGRRKKYSRKGFQSQPNLSGLHTPRKICC